MAPILLLLSLCLYAIFCLMQAESLQAECDFTKEQVAAMKGKTHYLKNLGSQKS